MSSGKEPVPNVDRRVYMRRRIGALVAILAFAVAVVLVFLRPGTNEGAATVTDVEVPSDLVVAEQVDDEGEDADPDAIPPCAAGNLTVTPVLNAASYGPDEEPLMSLSIENTGNEECVAELGTAGMSFEITSGTDQIWQSKDCQLEGDYRSVVLQPGEPEETEPIPWNRERSGVETCDLEREKVVAGGASYHLSVTVAGVKSRTSVQFQLY